MSADFVRKTRLVPAAIDSTSTYQNKRVERKLELILGFGFNFLSLFNSMAEEGRGNLG